MTAPRTTGATAAGDNEKRPIWPWLLLAAAIAALLLWWLVAALGDDGEEFEPGAEVGVEEPVDRADADAADAEDATDETPAGPAPATAGAVLVGDVDVFDPAADLAALVGRPVEADTVTVIAVPADEAFFVGPEPSQALLVRLAEFAGDTESPFDVQEGEQVSFTGTLEQVDEALLSELQLPQGSPELQAGDFYVQADETSSVD